MEDPKHIVFCDRCGAEIPSGWPVAYYNTEDGPVVMHRFSTMCDPKGVEFVQSLNQKAQEWKEPAD